jgi:excisionase family DNA binding protein
MRGPPSPIGEGPRVLAYYFMENLLNVKQAAFILKVHPLSIRRYIREKKLKAVKAAGNVRIKESDLLEFNKEYSTMKTDTPSPIKTKLRPAVSFTIDDPFLRLKGRGASLTLTE